MNIVLILLLFFGSIGGFLSIIFFSKSAHKNKLFGIFLLLVSYNVVFNVLYWTIKDGDFFVNLFFTYLIPLSLYGPVFYLYIKIKTLNSKFRLKELFHFIPFFATLVFYGNYFLLSPARKLEVKRNNTILEYVIMIPNYEIFLIILTFVYSLVIYVKFKKSYQDDFELKVWFKFISISFIIFSLTFVFNEIIIRLPFFKLEYEIAITCFMCLVIGVTAYFAHFYSSIFYGKPLNEVLPFIKYEKTGLSKEVSLEFKQKLLQIMETEKPYLDCELRLNHLADKLDINRNQTSQVINENFEQSFFEFINTYRVAESQKLLKLKDHKLTISDIAYQSGFNNRASFHKAFKKTNGVTPSEYRKRN